MSVLIFIFFVTAFLSLLFLIHFFVFRSFFELCALFGPLRKRIELALSFALPFSFFLAAFLARTYENEYTRAGYLLAGVWLGFFVNLFLAAVALRIIIFTARRFRIETPARMIASGLLSFAVLVSGFGIWTAFHPVVERVSVTIPNLPEHWRGKTIVQLSDVHLGSIYREDFLRGVVDRVNALRPEAVMITGDLFDGADGNLQGIATPLSDLRSTYGTFFITGNHETYLGTNRAFAAIEDGRMRILDDEVVDIGGIALVGVSYPEREDQKDVPALLSTLSPQFEGKPSILLYHAPVAIPEVAKSGINLQLSGHTHRGQQFPFQLVTNLVHKGYDYGLYRIGAYSLYTSSGVGTWGPPMRIGTQSEIVVITLEEGK